MSHNDSRIISPGLPGEAADKPVREYVPPEGPTVSNVVNDAEDGAHAASGDATPNVPDFPYSVAGDNIVVIEMTTDETYTPGGLYIPDDIANKDTRAEVLVIGVGPHAHIALQPETVDGLPAPLERTYRVVVGDLLIVHKNRWVGLEIDEREMKVLKPDAIIAINEQRDTAS